MWRRELAPPALSTATPLPKIEFHRKSAEIAEAASLLHCRAGVWGDQETTEPTMNVSDVQDVDGSKVLEVHDPSGVLLVFVQ